MLQKVREQGIKFRDERTFWHEMILKIYPSVLKGLPKVGIKLLKLSHARMFFHPKILFLVPLLFVALQSFEFLYFSMYGSLEVASNHNTIPSDNISEAIYKQWQKQQASINFTC